MKYLSSIQLPESTSTLALSSVNASNLGLKFYSSGLMIFIAGGQDTVKIGTGYFATNAPLNFGSQSNPPQISYSGNNLFIKAGTLSTTGYISVQTGNLLVGTTTDNGNTLQVGGTFKLTAGGTGTNENFKIVNSSGGTIIQALDNGNVGIGGNAETSASYKLRVHGGIWAGSFEQLNTLNGTAGVGRIEYYNTGGSHRTLGFRTYGPHAAESVKGFIEISSQALTYSGMGNIVLHADADFADHPTLVIRSLNTAAESFYMQNYHHDLGALFITNAATGGDNSMRFRPGRTSDVLVVNTGGIEVTGSIVKAGGTSSEFLKADGSVDSNTYLTSYTESQTLDDVTTLGNTTTNGISVGSLAVDTDLIYTDTVNGRIGINTTNPLYGTIHSEGNIFLANNKFLQSKDGGSTIYNLIGVISSGIVQVGQGNRGLTLRGGGLSSDIVFEVASSNRVTLKGTTYNFLIGTTVDAGYRLAVVGDSRVTGISQVYSTNTLETIDLEVYRDFSGISSRKAATFRITTRNTTGNHGNQQIDFRHEGINSSPNAVTTARILNTHIDGGNGNSYFYIQTQDISPYAGSLRTKIGIDSYGNIQLTDNTDAYVYLGNTYAYGPRIGKVITIGQQPNTGFTGDHLILRGGSPYASADKTGGNLILQGGYSTGTAGSNIILQVPVKGTTGTTLNTTYQTAVYVDSDANVGIGTTTPTEVLHVEGSGIVLRSASYSDSGFTISDDIYDYRIGTVPPQLRSNYIHIQRNGSNTLFHHSSGAFKWVNSGSEKMQLTSGGNLLINTTTDAGFRLDVNGNTRSTQFVVVDGSTIISRDGTYLRIHGTSGVKITAWDGGYKDALVVLPTSGNVGIGVGSASHKLNVDGGVAADYFQLDTTATPTPTQGMIYWDADEETAAVQVNGFNYEIGQGLYWVAKNQTGSQINKGTAVYASGTLGSSGRLLISPMIADGSVPAKYFLGITAEDIADGDDGKVITQGKIRQIDTSGYGAAGNVLWVSATTAGALTQTKPTGSNLALAVAFVVDFAANGTLAARVSNLDENSIGVVPTLDQVTTAGNTTANTITVGGLTANNKVYLGSNTPHSNDATNIVTVNGIMSLSNGYIRIDGQNRVQISTTGWTFNTAITPVAVGFAGYSNQDFTLRTGNASYNLDLGLAGQTNLRIANTTGNVLIGTTTDSGYKLDVNGSVRFVGEIFSGSYLGTQTSRLKLKGVTSGTSTAYFITGEHGSNNTNLFYIREDGAASFGSVRATYSYINSIEPQSSGTTLILKVFSGATYGAAFQNGFDYNHTSGDRYTLRFGQSFAPTSGTGGFGNIIFNHTINQTGGANGTVRGIYYTPTLTSLLGDHIAIETTSGKIIHQGLTNSTQSNVVYYDSTTGELTYGTAPSVATPTLDAVTTAGNTTTNAISTSDITVIGSGNTSSQFPLRVYNSDLSYNIGLEIKGDLSFRIGGYQTGPGAGITGTNSSNILYRAPSQSFYSYTVERLRIDSSTKVVNGNFIVESGNTLIGTTTDAGYKLDVNGTARVLNTLCVNTGNVSGEGIQLGSDLNRGIFINSNAVQFRQYSGFYQFTRGNSGATTLFYTDGNGLTTSTDFGINIGGGYTASSILTLTSTTRGFLQPRMTNAQALAIATPATGLQAYDTTNNKNLLYNGTSWLNIATETWVGAQSYATQSYVTTAISNLVDSAPSTLDTLNELAAALGDDPNFATTVTNSIASKVPQTRTLTINGTAYDLSADRSWTITSGLQASVDAAKVTAVAGIGLTTITTLPVASFDAARFEYVVKSGLNLRTGTIMAVWDGTTAQFTETTTSDLGNTTDITFTVAVNGPNVELNANSGAGGWTVKAVPYGI